MTSLQASISFSVIIKTDWRAGATGCMSKHFSSRAYTADGGQHKNLRRPRTRLNFASHSKNFSGNAFIPTQSLSDLLTENTFILKDHIQ